MVRTERCLYPTRVHLETHETARTTRSMVGPIRDTHGNIVGSDCLQVPTALWSSVLHQSNAARLIHPPKTKNNCCTHDSRFAPRAPTPPQPTGLSGTTTSKPLTIRSLTLVKFSNRPPCFHSHFYFRESLDSSEFAQLTGRRPIGRPPGNAAEHPGRPITSCTYTPTNCRTHGVHGILDDPGAFIAGACAPCF